MPSDTTRIGGPDPAFGPEETARQLQLYAQCVFEPDDIVEIRRLPSARSSWSTARDLPSHAKPLLDENADEQNIYVGANPRTTDGGKSTDDVALARIVFVDFDGVTCEQAEQAIQHLGLPRPTLLIHSGHGVHAFWRLLKPVTDLRAWTTAQKQFIAALGTDKVVHDPPRIMRLPAFINHKPPIAQATIIEADPTRRFALEKLVKCLPKQATTNSSATAPSTPGGTTNVGSSSPSTGSTLNAIARAAKYTAKVPGVGQGERNSAAWHLAALLTHDFKLTVSEALPLLQAWNQTNRPPLDADELNKCLTNGARYGRSAPGCKLDVPFEFQTFGTAVPLPDDFISDAFVPPAFNDVQQTAPPWLTLAEIGNQTAYSNGLTPVTTGYASLDKQLRGGFRPETTNVIAGRTGSAKSTFTANIARRASLAGVCVLLLKLEESATEAMWRMHAATSKVELITLLGGINRAPLALAPALDDARQLLGSLPIRISTERNLDRIEQIVARHATDGGHLVLIDQLSMISIPGADIGYALATEVSNRLRIVAREQRIPIVIVAQVNRDAAKRNGRLNISDLRDSGAIENDASTVILIDRVKEASGSPGDPRSLRLPISVGKNRYGPISKKDKPIDLMWRPPICRIDEPVPDQGTTP